MRHGPRGARPARTRAASKSPAAAGSRPGCGPLVELPGSRRHVVLSDVDVRDNALIDSVDFPALAADVSYGRTPEATGPFGVLAVASPGGVPHRHARARDRSSGAPQATVRVVAVLAVTRGSSVMTPATADSSFGSRCRIATSRNVGRSPPPSTRRKP